MDQKKERPQDKWNRENGLISKTYKLRKNIADDFAAAVEKIGDTKKNRLEIMMQDFVAKVETGEIKSKDDK